LFRRDPAASLVLFIFFFGLVICSFVNFCLICCSTSCKDENEFKILFVCHSCNIFKQYKHRLDVPGKTLSIKPDRYPIAQITSISYCRTYYYCQTYHVEQTIYHSGQLTGLAIIVEEYTLSLSLSRSFKNEDRYANTE